MDMGVYGESKDVTGLGNKRSPRDTAKIEVQVFGLGRPITPKMGFNTATDRPAAVGGTVADGA
jgi:hypothetical protein